MNRHALRVMGVGKRYAIGERAPYGSLRESIMRLAARRRAAPAAGRRTLWALRDVSFAVEAGEVVGVIGRNGAGKSTLLRILSRITAPTEGRVELHGRVGSLLEVGAGFHPELTGRENIFLNGSILGMRRAEIVAKLDEIIGFAEVGELIDTPVKRYSSGLYMRLAFAVAAHLDPEILLVDEVLAVGDAIFQKKCLGRMQSVAAAGRTVLFVSHSMPAVARLCPRVLLLHDGRLDADGPAAEVIERYLSAGAKSPALRTWSEPASAPGDDTVRLLAVRVRDEAGALLPQADIGQPIGIDIEFVNLKAGARLVPNVHLHNELGINLFTSINASLPGWYNQPHPEGAFRATCWIPGNFLAEGRITVRAVVSTHNPDAVHADAPEAVAFVVTDPLRGDGARGEFARDFPGVVRPLLRWTMERLPAARGTGPAPG
jgi:lipopolysaccharide transport system ATP-binding protein